MGKKKDSGSRHEAVSNKKRVCLVPLQRSVVVYGPVRSPFRIFTMCMLWSRGLASLLGLIWVQNRFASTSTIALDINVQSSPDLSLDCLTRTRVKRRKHGGDGLRCTTVFPANAETNTCKIQFDDALAT